MHALVATDVIDMGEAGNRASFIYRLADPPAELLQALQSLAPKMRFDPKSEINPYLTNHCEHCDTAQGESALFEEVDGPFTGRPPEGHFGPVIAMHDLKVGSVGYSS